MSGEDRAFDVVIHSGTVIPMTGRGQSFIGTVGIRNGRITALSSGSGSELDGRQVIDATGCLVVPGLIQAHVHVVQSLLRHQADDMALLDWLRLRTWPYEAALDADAVEAAAELGIAELLRGGTTTVLDFGTTHDHDRVFQAAERMGIRMISGMTHMDMGDGAPSALLNEAHRSLAEAEALGLRWHGAAEGRLRYAVAPRFALSCTRDLLEGCADLARRHGWLLETHASENRDEVAAVKAMTGLDNVRYLDAVGLTGDDVVLAHGVHLKPDEVELLATTRTRICHCPGANLKLASGIADIPGLLEAGVPVALGADGPPCNNRLSIFQEMSLAATLHKLRHGPEAMDAWTVLELATCKGAEALHLDAEVGTLEVGKRADVVIVDAGAWSMLPAGDPAARLVYGATAADVRDVLVDGRILVQGGRLVGADSAGIRDRVHEAWRVTRRRMQEVVR